MTWQQTLEERILPIVEKPSRYLGSERNAVHKDVASTEVHVALAFPDLYDIGLGNLGIHILYACVNKLDWAYCERLYAPALDMEAQMREHDIPLFTLESKTAASELDLIGFTLQSELTYTNILNLLDLAGLSLRTEDREEDDPLTCAGGPAVFNPEPLAPFVDFFVIGDGEDAIVEIVELLRVMKDNTRAERLEALSKLQGIYVPELYPFETLEDGQILPKVDHPKVRKRITADLNGATFPVDYIVPYTQQVHDRVSLEVLRGCTQGCRFCQAGMTTRPVRERSLEEIDSLMTRTLDSTGYEEVSLVSLSTCDYSRVRQMVENTVETAKPRRVSVSLPSLRLDSFSVELADMVAETRRTGLTVAPEAASPRLRAVINKWIPDEELLKMCTGAYELGWGHVKMYFMLGLPTERDDDIVAISDLAKEAVSRGSSINPKAKANLGVSTFVPKPFTPFQWAAQIGLEETTRKQNVLRAALDRDRRIKFGRHDPEETFLEGLVSRADRRAADLIELAFRKGCRFEAWREHLRFDLWLESIDELGYDVEFALRERQLDERLPWDHIDILVDKEWFQADWERAVQLKHAQDCRHRKCHKCGVIDHERELCATMLRRSIHGRKPEDAWVKKKVEPAVEPPPVQRLWVRISRTGPARFLSHLESMNAWLRALRRAHAPLSYSQGFHPHPKFAFSAALPQNVASHGEYMDMTLVAAVNPEEFLESLAATLPEGFGAHAIREVPIKAPSLMSINLGMQVTLLLPEEDIADVRAKAEAFMASDEHILLRRSKRKKTKGRGGYRGPKPLKPVNARPMVQELVVREEGGIAMVDLRLGHSEGKPGKAREIATILAAAPERATLIKRDTLTVVDGELCSLFSWKPAPKVEAKPPSDKPSPSA